MSGHGDGPRFARLRLLADDLSGAADCAASFTGDGGALPLYLHRARPTDARCAVDLDTRWREAGQARASFAAAARALAGEARDALLYKKIDSTLRGHVGVELAAMLEALPRVRLAIVAPAFPQQGRTLEGGIPRVRGEAIAGWKRPLDDVLRDALGPRVEVTRAPATTIDISRAADPIRVVIADARDDHELETLARAVRSAPARPLLVGSSGFARALAGRPRTAARVPGPALAVVGSFSAVARAQVRAVANAGAARVLRWDGEAELAGDLVRALAAGENALVHVDAGDGAPREPTRELVRRLAACAAPAARDCATLFLTGGDTARAFLDALAIDALEIEGEIEPGIPAAAAPAPSMPRIILKAGGFGDNELLVRLLA